MADKKDKKPEKAIEDFVVAAGGLAGGPDAETMRAIWKQDMEWLKEHQAACKKEHCHLCWRGDFTKW